MIATIKQRLATLLKGWRTALFGLAVTAVGFWDACSSAGIDITPLIPEGKRPVALTLIGLAVLGLRCVTTSSLGKK